MDMLAGSGMNAVVMKIMPVQKQRTRFKALALGHNNVHIGCGVKCRKGKTTKIFAGSVEKYTTSVGAAQYFPDIGSGNHYGAFPISLAVFSFSTLLLNWVIDKFGKEFVKEWSKYALKKWPKKYNAYETMGSNEVGVKRCKAEYFIPTADSKMLQTGFVVSVGMRKNVTLMSILDSYWPLLWFQPSRVCVNMVILYARSKAKDLYIDDEDLDVMIKENDIVGQLVFPKEGWFSLQPFNDRVLIQVNGKQFKQYYVGRVIAFGTGVVKAGRTMSLPLKVDDKVLYTRTFASEGADFIVIRMSEIYLVY